MTNTGCQHCDQSIEDELLSKLNLRMYISILIMKKLYIWGYAECLKKN